MVVTDDTSQLEISLLKEGALKNSAFMVVTDETSQPEIPLLKAFASINILYILVTTDTSHLEISPLKTDAVLNISCMLVTDDTSQLERSALILLPIKNWYMLVTSEVSKHWTMALFEEFSDKIVIILASLNAKLIP